MPDKWEKAGHIFVDAGCVMVGDPCYTQGADASNASASWDEFLEKTWPNAFGPNADPNNHKMADPEYARREEGIGIVVGSGYGDGDYPVFIRRNDEGRVMELRVVFDEYEDGDLTPEETFRELLSR